jgi:peptidase M28-like protein
VLRRDPDLERIRADVAALAGMTRSSARSGELRSAEWLSDRLRSAGIADVSVERYRYQRTYALAHGLHSLAGIAAVRRGGLAGALAAAAVLGSYEAEASGRRQWIRTLLPKGEGANVIARVPAAGQAHATLLLVAHHDAANTGLVWNPAFVHLGARRHLRRRRVDPFMAPVSAALAAGAAGSALARRFRAGRWMRLIAGALLATSIAADIDVARSPTVPGASDNASGVAVVIELVRALAESPPDGFDVIALLPGTEEAGMGGMAAFLRRHADELGPSPFVLGLDTLGAGTPIVASGEGPMREHRYPPAAMAIADEGAAIAGEARPERWRIGGWTDPILAVFAGIPAVSILSMGPGYFPNYHCPTDVPENVDWRSVHACARIAAGAVQAFGRAFAGTPYNRSPGGAPPIPRP